MHRILRNCLVLTGVFTAIGAASARERMTPPASVEAVLAGLPESGERLEPHSPAREAIAAGRIEEARRMLSFRPLLEAPLPEGFPAYTPVGVIEVKRYPAYRKAVGPNFWTLFGHISRRDIPMTTPVEMREMVPDSGQREMAFLYQNIGVGEPGAIDGVEITDTPATLVVAIGLRGAGEDEVADARDRLEAWLAEQSEYRQACADAFRLFGFNSPQVPRADRFSEAQLVIEPVE